MSRITSIHQSSLPAPTPNEQFERRCDKFMELYRRATLEFRSEPNPLRTLADEVGVAVAQLPEFEKALAEMSRPATRKEIADHLTAMVLNFHNASRGGGDFAVVMINAVCAQQPSFLILDQAIRQIIYTRRFLPVTAEVLEHLEEARSRTDRLQNWIAALPRLKAELEQRLLDVDRRERLRVARAGAEGRGAELPKNG